MKFCLKSTRNVVKRIMMPTFNWCLEIMREKGNCKCFQNIFGLFLCNIKINDFLFKFNSNDIFKFI